MEKPREKWREDLINNNRLLVYDCVKKFRSFYLNNKHDKDDLIGEAFRVLIIQADRYDPTRSEFSTFCRSGINRHLTRYIANEILRRKIEVQFPSMRDNGDDAAICQVDIDVDEPPEEIGDVMKSTIAAAMEVLEVKDREIINLRFFEGKKLEEIAEIYKVSHQAIDKRIKKCLNKMRAYVDPELLDDKDKQERKPKI